MEHVLGFQIFAPALFSESSPDLQAASTGCFAGNETKKSIARYPICSSGEPVTSRLVRHRKCTPAFQWRQTELSLRACASNDFRSFRTSWFRPQYDGSVPGKLRGIAIGGAALSDLPDNQRAATYAIATDSHIGLDRRMAQLPADQTAPVVVVGASIAGLLAATVLSELFDSVVLVERDELDVDAAHMDVAAATHRRGVPQSVQAHVLLARGFRILCDLFPGFEDDLLHHGALRVDWARDFRLFWAGKPLAVSPEASDLVSCTSSRVLLETVIRKRVAANPKVRWITGARATHLLTQKAETSNGTQVHGLVLELKDDAQMPVYSPLIVDASGRGTVAERWLAENGAPIPERIIVDGQLAYSTRRFKLPRHHNPVPEIGDWKVVQVHHEPPGNPRHGYLARIENDEIVAVLGGFGGLKNHPPRDSDGWFAFAKSLPSPVFYNIVKDLEPASPIYHYKGTANVLREYHKLRADQVIDGFIPFGDSRCCLCPLYGQGMTVAAESAIALRSTLLTSRSTHGNGIACDPALTQDLHAALGRVVASTFAMATREDLRFPSTTSTRWYQAAFWSVLMAVIAKYEDLLIRRSYSKPAVARIIVSVAQLILPQTALFHPTLLVEALFGPKHDA